MGLSFRKSIKLGKNIRINLGKNGIGVSAGVKGARVSVSKKGVRTTLSKGGLQYSKNHSFKKNNRSEQKVIKEPTYDKSVIDDLKIVSPRLPVEETNKIFKWFGIGILLMIIGATVFPVALLAALLAMLYAFKTMIFNKIYRSKWVMHKAMACYKKQQYDRSKQYCYKALRIYEDNSSAKKLISILEAS